MTTTSTADSLYVVIDGNDDGDGALRVVSGTSSTQLFQLGQNGGWYFTGAVIATNRFFFNQRKIGVDIMDFADHNNVHVAKVGEHGRWKCGARGARFVTLAGPPADTPPAGTARTVSDTATPKYGLAVYTGSTGGWRYISVT